MFKFQVSRPSAEDAARALGYAVWAFWGVLYLIYPPPPVPEVLELSTRLSWMLPTIVGAVFAILGALTRIDIKLELPAIILAIPGPVFYGITQLWLIFHPEILQSPAEGRYAISVYAFLPTLLLLPRLLWLLRERKRLRRINAVRLQQISLMTDEERAQPGAGIDFMTLSTPVVEKKGKH